MRIGSDPFNGFDGTRTEWADEWKKWEKEHATEWTGTVDLPEGAVTIGSVTEKKIVQQKRNESGRHHFQAASRLKDLLSNSRLAVVEEPVGKPNVAEVHKRYAWADFPDGSTRHVMMTVLRWKETPLDSDTAYSLEAIETIESKTPSENRDNHSPSDGVQTAHHGGNEILGRFVAGFKPEHRWIGRSTGVFSLGLPSRDAVGGFLKEGGVADDKAGAAGAELETAFAGIAGAEAGWQMYFWSGMEPPATKGKAAGKAAAAPDAAESDPDAAAGLRGDAAALARAVGRHGRVSSIIARHVSREIPAWNVRGMVFANAADVHAALLGVRSPYFESLKIAVLDDNMKVVHSQVVTAGSINESIADTKGVLAVLMRVREDTGKKYNKIILAHNHPSGTPSPSDSDDGMTRLHVEAARAMGFTVLDHIITNGETYYSYREQGLYDVGTPAAEYRRKVADSAKANPARTVPGRQAQAGWEVVARSELQGFGGYNGPETLERYVGMLRQGDPANGHVFYLSTRYGLLGVERIEDMLDKMRTEEGRMEVKRRIMAGAGREGAYGLLVDLGEGRAGGWMVDERGAINDLKEFSHLVRLRLLDVAKGPVAGFSSAVEAGVMEQGPAGGAFSLGVPMGSDEIASTIDGLADKQFREKRLSDTTPRSALLFWMEKMVGSTFRLPNGIVFSPRPGHFFRFVCGGINKGKTAAVDAAQALEKIASGEFTEKDISGYEAARAAQLPRVPEMLEQPQAVVTTPHEKGKPTIQLVSKISSSKYVVAIGYEAESGSFAPQSFGIRRTQQISRMAGTVLLPTGPNDTGTIKGKAQDSGTAQENNAADDRPDQSKSFSLGSYRPRLRGALERADSPPEYRRKAVEVARKRLVEIERRHRERVAAAGAGRAEADREAMRAAVAEFQAFLLTIFVSVASSGRWTKQDHRVGLRETLLRPRNDRGRRPTRRRACRGRCPGPPTC